MTATRRLAAIRAVESSATRGEDEAGAGRAVRERRNSPSDSVQHE